MSSRRCQGCGAPQADTNVACPFCGMAPHEHGTREIVIEREIEREVTREKVTIKPPPPPAPPPKPPKPPKPPLTPEEIARIRQQWKRAFGCLFKLVGGISLLAFCGFAVLFVVVFIAAGLSAPDERAPRPEAAVEVEKPTPAMKTGKELLRHRKTPPR